MEIRDKTRKPYRKPQISQVKWVLEEAVLQGCKVTTGGPSKSSRGCDHPGCKRPGS